MMAFLLLVTAYLFGSISSAVIVSRILGLPDPRSNGSNNAGATNILRLGGKKAAAITLVGDFFKGLLPVVITRIITQDLSVIAAVGVLSFLGHLYPVFFGFKGGKGVATAAGVFIGLSVQVGVLLIFIWMIVALVWRYSSLSALVTAGLSPFIVHWSHGIVDYTLMTIFMSVLLFWRHKKNIKRLLNREESKIHFSKST